MHALPKPDAYVSMLIAKARMLNNLTPVLFRNIFVNIRFIRFILLSPFRLAAELNLETFVVKKIDCARVVSKNMLAKKLHYS